MSETTMPYLIWQGFRRLRLVWFAPDRFERMEFVFAVDRFESPELAMRDCFRHNIIVDENICSFHRMHVDFETFSQQNVARKQIRVHPRHMQYLVHDYRSEVAALAFNREMNVPCADAEEFTFCCINFNRFIESLVVDQDMSVWREVLRGTRIEDPMFWIAVLVVSAILPIIGSERLRASHWTEIRSL